MAKNALALNRYTNMEFPEYEYVEFPKWVTPEGGKPTLVQDEEEEATVMAGAEVVREEDERAEVHLEAQNKGVQFDKRWSVQRIRTAIVDHDKRVKAAAEAV